MVVEISKGWMQKILNTLMHLFAIIAPAQGRWWDSEGLFEAFLRPQLNQEGVGAYLRIFDCLLCRSSAETEEGQ
ncbi:MAG: hypothetical protein U5L72_08375 [Bacteroidales bacterium]|nr:hypothetical protein [Bacteroidales bacterium]